MFAFQLLFSNRPVSLDAQQIQKLERCLEVKNREQAEEAARKVVPNNELDKTYDL